MNRLKSHTVLAGACALTTTSWSVPASLFAQFVTCELSEVAAGRLAGQCLADADPTSIELARADSVTDALWTGTMGGDGGPSPIEIATYQYSSGPRLVVRTRAWHIVSEFVFSKAGLRIAWDDGVEAPPSQTDLEIFEAARLLLPNEGAWDRADDRNCENDVGVISVYCALAGATALVMGRYQHRQPAMQAVRRVIASEWPERVVDHRLMNFNNDARTTLADVHHLFDLAAESLRGAIR
jgi:hypothetical protein